MTLLRAPHFISLALFASVGFKKLIVTCIACSAGVLFTRLLLISYNN